MFFVKIWRNNIRTKVDVCPRKLKKKISRRKNRQYIHTYIYIYIMHEKFQHNMSFTLFYLFIYL